MNKCTIIAVFALLRMSELSAQIVNVKALEAKASWSIGDMDRVVFESYSMRNIARYDSFPSALATFLNDAEKRQLDFLDTGGYSEYSLPKPCSMHYILFPDGKRKMTIENPEYLNQNFNYEKELIQNQDSLPSNVIHIYDARFDISISIYLESLNRIDKLKNIVEYYRKDQHQSSNHIDSMLKQAKSISEELVIGSIIGPVMIRERWNGDYWAFQQSLRSRVELDKRPRLSNHIDFYSDEHSVIISENDTTYVQRMTVGQKGVFQRVNSHLGVGFLGNNVCAQMGLDVTLFVHYEQDLPKELFYISAGGTFYSDRTTDRPMYNAKALFEGLIGLKLTNVSPNLKSSSDYRAVGLEMGVFAGNNQNTALYSPGWAIKSYRQWGNIRLTTGFYTTMNNGYFDTWKKDNVERLSSALLFTVEVFDLVGVSQSSRTTRWRGTRY